MNGFLKFTLEATSLLKFTLGGVAAGLLLAFVAGAFIGGRDAEIFPPLLTTVLILVGITCGFWGWYCMATERGFAPFQPASNAGAAGDPEPFTIGITPTRHGRAS